jgi:hypothetical protein
MPTVFANDLAHDITIHSLNGGFDDLRGSPFEFLVMLVQCSQGYD